jgi:hypothetical protein
MLFFVGQFSVSKIIEGSRRASPKKWQPPSLPFVFVFEKYRPLKVSFSRILMASINRESTFLVKVILKITLTGPLFFILQFPHGIIFFQGSPRIFDLLPETV